MADHLDLTVPYEFEGRKHNYIPDFLVSLRGKDGAGTTVILEVKGYETEEDRQKHAAAQRWVSAVNHHGGFGRWAFVVCREPRRLAQSLRGVVKANAAGEVA